MRLFASQKKDKRREERRDPPWLRKTKLALLTIGGLLISISLLLFYLGQAVSLGLALLIIGFFAVALTVSDEQEDKG